MQERKQSKSKNILLTGVVFSFFMFSHFVTAADAVLLTDPNDARNWQGATVGTFAQLYFGSDTLANRQLIIDNHLLDDGLFNPAGYQAATWVQGGGGCLGQSTDSTGTGSFDYACNGSNVAEQANTIDDKWYQDDAQVGQTVFDLGFDAQKAAVFPSIDHGPFPNEAIESTVYLSNDKSNWTEAQVQRVWLEGWEPNLGIKWDGFVYAVGTPNNSTFRYASLINGGPGALQHDGDDEINGILGLRSDFTGNPGGPTAAVPEPATMLLFGAGTLGLGFKRRRQK